MLVTAVMIIKALESTDAGLAVIPHSTGRGNVREIGSCILTFEPGPGLGSGSASGAGLGLQVQGCCCQLPTLCCQMAISASASIMLRHR